MSATTKNKSRVLKQEKIINDAPRRFSEADFPIGTAAHQGDLILVRIDRLPASARPRREKQLAAGNTQGARHVVGKGRVYECDPTEVAAAIAAACPGTAINAAYIGPVFTTESGAADLLHPEHGDHHYRGDMTIASVFQRNLDAEEREQRVQD
jgi:hypothetical protein